MFRFIGTKSFFSTPKDENQDSTVVHLKGLEEDKTYEIRIVAVDGKYETPSEMQEISSLARSYESIYICFLFFPLLF